MNKEMSEATRKLASVIVPLKKREQQAAIKVARDHLTHELSDHVRILGAELRIDKPAKPGAVPLRMISVIVIDYAKRRNVEVLVDGSGEVAKVNDLRGAQPAYTAEEVAEARDIAEQDDRAARFRKMKGMFVSEFGPERAADHARRIGLRYVAMQKGRPVRIVAHAIVDMSARRLVDFEETSVSQEPGR